MAASERLEFIQATAMAVLITITLAGCGDAVLQRHDGREGASDKPEVASTSRANAPTVDRTQSAADRGVPTKATDSPTDSAGDSTTASTASPGHQGPTYDADSQSIPQTGTPQQGPSLEKALADLRVPPAWLDSVPLEFDTTQPWNKAWDRIEQLLMTADDDDRQRAIKLAYVYQRDGRAKVGYPAAVYFLAGECAWAIREFLSLEEKNSTTYMRLASCYLHFNEHHLALETLKKAESQISENPPWDGFRRAQVLEAKGDVYMDMKNTDGARDAYRKAVELYDLAQLPGNQQYVKTRSIRSARARLDMADQLALLTTRLQDGTYNGSAPGYTDQIQARVSIKRGTIADIQIDHQEMADLQATRIIPERIIDQQDLRVDAISGATITSHAVTTSVFEALKKSAGLE